MSNQLNTQELQGEEFHASNGWFERCKARLNVSFEAIAGKEKAVTPEMISSRRETHLPTILSRFELREIYNAIIFNI